MEEFPKGGELRRIANDDANESKFRIPLVKSPVAFESVLNTLSLANLPHEDNSEIVRHFRIGQR